MRLPLCGPSALAVLLLLAAAPAARAQDIDQDGTPDAVDAFPCDPERAAVSYLPGERQWGTLMFENNWPARGDLDFNDAVLAYNYAVFSNGAGGVTSVVLTLDPLALGAYFDDGLALHLPIARDRLTAATLRIGDAAPLPLSARADEPDVVVTIAPNLRALFDDAPGFINTDASSALVDGPVVVLTLVFAGGVGLAVGADPFDLFFFKADNPARQIHRPQFDGTAAMDRGYFGTGDDGSTATRRFIDRDGLPFVLSMPELVPWASELTPIEALYPDIVTFAASGGQSARDFYDSTVVSSASYGPSPGGAGLVPASPIGDRSCVVEQCNGVDENADGALDEGNPGGGVSCATGLPGVCSAGLTQCTSGALVCEPEATPGVEVCNGLDDDCDGVADEVVARADTHFANSAEGWSIEGDGTHLRLENGALVVDDLADGIYWFFVAPASYGGDLSGLYGGVISYRLRVSTANGNVGNDSITLFGANGARMQQGLPALPTTTFTTYTFPVVAGAWVDAGGAPLSEAAIRAILADVTRVRIRGEYSSAADVGYLDDITLAATDPAFGAGGGASCATGELGLCGDGTVTCGAGALSCVRNVAPSIELCNGLDDDCDGVVDEGQPESGLACSTGQLGVCAAGTTACGGGALSCARNVAPSTEVCNGVDDDCDGTTDEGCAIAESHFDSGIEGWSYEGDGTNIRVTGGALTVTDRGDGSIWYFVAPAAFTGDLSAAYGGALNYRLRVSSQNITGANMVTIFGANGLAMQRSTAYPTTSFTSYSLPLSPGAWINATTGATLTEAEIRSVLGSVSRLRIRGEWANNIDTGYLDDVVITRGN